MRHEGGWLVTGRGALPLCSLVLLSWVAHRSPEPPPLPSLPCCCRRCPQVVGSSTKTLSFFKPHEDDVFAVGGSAEAAAGVAAEAQEDE